MSRRLLLPLAVLALLAAPAYASFTPTPGHYVGHAPHYGPYPVSFTLIVAVVLLAIGVMAIASMVFRIGPFD